ncbi:hypothetical protein T484DRAFT_1892898 [Baffinella frigidus]|nr:hypothetical protein T484DRAFT_1892898 [Cryptophyta sp. CCMP2293]
MASLLGRREGMSPHKQAVAAIAAISAAMLLASACVLMAGTGHRTGLLEHVVERAPYMSARALAHSPVWRQDVTKAVADKERQLQKAKKQVGEQLKQDMTQLFDAKDTDLKQEHTKLHELKQVEVMKGRYEAILHAIETAPVLTPEAPDDMREAEEQLGGGAAQVAPKGAKQAQAQQEKGMKVVDERNGRVYVLYPYNPAPGGYADKELSPDPLMADDEKTFGNFNDPISRNPIYQGHAPDYADGAPLPQYMGTRASPQRLYAYNAAPGGTAPTRLDPPTNNDAGAVVMCSAARERCAVLGLGRPRA